MKRLISVILIALLIFSSVPTVFAASDERIGNTTVSVIKTAFQNAISECTTSVNLNSYSIKFTNANAKKINDLYNQVLDDNPTFFHIKNYSIAYVSGGNMVSAKLNYQYSKTTYQSMLSDVEDIANNLIKDLKGKNLTDLETALIIHDRLAVLCEYDYENFLKYEGGDYDAIPFDSFNIYGVFVKNTAVCEGYSYAYKYLLNKMGIDAWVCKSDTLQHMWNVVEIDGKNYHVDLTYDDPAYDITGRVMHDYFLLSTSALKEKGHNVNDISNTTPTATNYDNYFWQDVDAQFCYLNGKLYYINNEAETLNSYYHGESEELISVEDDWYMTEHLRYIGNFSRLDTDGETLFFNLTDTIYSYDVTTGEKKSIYTPDTSGYENFSLFGFKVKNGSFYYDLNNGVYDVNTKKLYSGQYRFDHCLSYSTVSLSTNSYTYSGGEKKPVPTVKLDGKTLKNGTDYTVSYSGNKNAGTAKVVLTGKGNYEGSVTKTFKINPKSISGFNFTKVSNKTYSGKQIKPTVTVKNGSTKLVNSKDYTVTYGTNKSTGKGIITIKGKGNYKSEKKITFYIVPKRVSVTKATPKKRSAYIKWKKATGASGYQITLATNSKFTKGKKTVTVSGSSSKSKTIKSLKSKKTYYVKVRAYKTVNGKKKYGEWSKVKKIKVK